jgi:probable HAF family extracellular repeat protein
MHKFTIDDLIRLRRRQYCTARCWAVARKLVLALSLTLTCQCALAQATYRIKPIPPLSDCPGAPSYVDSAAGLNAADDVTGDACNANGDVHAFLWRNDGTPMVDLGPPEVGSQSEGYGVSASGVVFGPAQDSTGSFAFESSGDGAPMKRIYDRLGGNSIYPAGINDLGQMTGDVFTSTAFRAFLWKNDGSPVLDLGTFGGFASSGAAINAAGQVAGISYYPGSFTPHAFIWKNDGKPLLDLGTLGGDYSYAYFINASGQVAGLSTLPKAIKPAGTTHPFLWSNDGTMQDLGALGGVYTEPYLRALNDAGQVAGTSYTQANNNSRAWVWINDGTPMQDLGTLGGTIIDASDMNSSGQVTGQSSLAGNRAFHAFLWRNDGTRIQDLNKLIDPTDALKSYVTLTSGDFINDRGDIVADGTDSRTGRGGLYLLQGTGLTGSVLTLAPRSLAFGNVPINTSSATQSVTVTNTSPNAVAITSIALRGTALKQFAFADHCGKSLAGHATCTLQAQFTPSTNGAKTAYLDVNGGGGGLRSVKLTGTGT